MRGGTRSHQGPRLCIDGEHPPYLKPLHDMAKLQVTDVKYHESKSGNHYVMASATAEDQELKKLGIEGALRKRIGFLEFTTAEAAKAAADKMSDEKVLKKLKLLEKDGQDLCEVVVG